MMNKYIENSFWNQSLKTQFQLEGYHNHPNPSCMPLPIPKYTNRNKEVILMSLMHRCRIFQFPGSEDFPCANSW